MSALDVEAVPVLRVEAEIDIPVVPVAAIETVEDGRVLGEEPRALRDPSCDLRMLARELGSTVREAHERSIA